MKGVCLIGAMVAVLALIGPYETVTAPKLVGVVFIVLIAAFLMSGMKA